MDADETAICDYLRTWPGTFVSGRQIARRASGQRRFRVDPNWAVPVLMRLVEQGLLESDPTGHYRLVNQERARGNRNKRWLSPQVRSILERQPEKFQVYLIPDNEEEEEEKKEEDEEQQ